MFIVIELQTNADGSVSNLVWAFSSKEQAFSKYHAILSAAAVSTLPVHAAVILDNKGLQIAAQAFEHGEVEPNE